MSGPSDRTKVGEMAIKERDGRLSADQALELWSDYKRTRESDAVRLRPTPHEFEMYFDS